MKHFLAAFRDIALFGGQGIEGRRVGGFAPQPFGHIFLTHFAPRRGDAGLAEIFLGENVAGDLRPSRRHLIIRLNTTDPSGLRISLLAVVKAIPA